MKRLILSRKIGERVRITVGDVKFYVSPSYVRGHRVKLCLEAPEHVRIDREEIPESDKDAA